MGTVAPPPISITGYSSITHQIEGIGYKTLSCISLCAEIAPRRDGGFAISVVQQTACLDSTIESWHGNHIRGVFNLISFSFSSAATKQFCLKTEYSLCAKRTLFAAAGQT